MLCGSFVWSCLSSSCSWPSRPRLQRRWRGCPSDSSTTRASAGRRIPTVNLASAQRANGSIVHILANWSTIAPTKPAHPLNGSDPAYHLSDIDALARSAQQYGFEVLLTISGTPKWANGGKTPNYPPTNMNDLTQFSQMLATALQRHESGLRRRDPLLGLERAEPRELFLAPQFSSSGKIVSPGTYAKLYMAAYKGIKAGNKVALVAAGETSNRGHNHHVRRA